MHLPALLHVPSHPSWVPTLEGSLLQLHAGAGKLPPFHPMAQNIPGSREKVATWKGRGKPNPSTLPSPGTVLRPWGRLPWKEACTVLPLAPVTPKGLWPFIRQASEHQWQRGGVRYKWLNTPPNKAPNRRPPSLAPSNPAVHLCWALPANSCLGHLLSSRQRRGEWGEERYTEAGRALHK